MSRNIFNQSYINYFKFSLVVLYVPFVSIYGLLPPLIGLMFALFMRHFKNSFYITIITIYTLFFDVSFSLMPFSLITWFFVLRFLFHSYLKAVVDCKKCTLFNHIALAYGGYFLFLYTLAFSFDWPFIEPKYLMVFYYIIVEFLVALLVINNK